MTGTALSHASPESSDAVSASAASGATGDYVDRFRYDVFVSYSKYSAPEQQVGKRRWLRLDTTWRCE